MRPRTAPCCESEPNAEAEHPRSAHLRPTLTCDSPSCRKPCARGICTSHCATKSIIAARHLLPQSSAHLLSPSPHHHRRRRPCCALRRIVRQRTTHLVPPWRRRVLLSTSSSRPTCPPSPASPMACRLQLPSRPTSNPPPTRREILAPGRNRTTASVSRLHLLCIPMPCVNGPGPLPDCETPSCLA